MSSPIMNALAFALLFLALACHPKGSSAFVVVFPEASSTKPLQRIVRPESLITRRAVETNDEKDTQEENESPLKTAQETKVYELLKDLSESELSFRIVVVGNGAILESTNPLGPTFKVGESPKTGASIVTFASEDQSFEFHLMPAQIASGVLVEKPSPKGHTMRILRLLNAEGGSICSLILSDDSEAAQSWYSSMASKYGSEIQF